MADTDIKLNDNVIEAECAVFKINGSDLMLNSTARRGNARGPHRRAIVHGVDDVLIINFNHDYTGGTAISGARINLHVHVQNDAPKLPKNATEGDLFAVRIRTPLGGIALAQPITLWLCTGHSPIGFSEWSPITLGQSVYGELE